MLYRDREIVIIFIKKMYNVDKKNACNVLNVENKLTLKYPNFIGDITPPGLIGPSSVNGGDEIPNSPITRRSRAQN